MSPSYSILLETTLIVLCVVLLLFKILTKEWKYVLIFLAFATLGTLSKMKPVIVFGTATVLTIAICFFTKESLEESFENDSDTDKKVDATPADDEKENGDEKKDEKDPENEKTPQKDDFAIDMASVMKDAYKQFSPEQLKNMTMETKELMETQANLMTTLKSLTPIVEQGMKLVDTFQNTSKNGNKTTADLFAAIKKLPTA